MTHSAPHDAGFVDVDHLSTEDIETRSRIIGWFEMELQRYHGEVGSSPHELLNAARQLNRENANERRAAIRMLRQAAATSSGAAPTLVMELLRRIQTMTGARMEVRPSNPESSRPTAVRMDRSSGNKIGSISAHGNMDALEMVDSLANEIGAVNAKDASTDKAPAWHNGFWGKIWIGVLIALFSTVITWGAQFFLR